MALFVVAGQDAASPDAEGAMVETRLQLIFREAVATRRSASEPSWNSQGVTEAEPFEVMIGLGHLEAAPSLLRDERMIDVVLSGDEHALGLSFRGEPYDPGFDWAGESDLPGLATAMTTRKPAGSIGRDAFGSFYLRETRFPTSPGRITYAVLGIAVVRKGALPARVMYDLEGEDLSLTQTSRREVADAYEIGASLRQTFQLPVWGWGLPTRAIGSTLPLSVIDAVSRIREIESLPEPTRAQTDELARLDAGPARSVLSCGRSDREFGRFKSLVREMGFADVFASADGYPDAQALSRRSEAAREVVAEMLRRDERSRPAAMR